MKRQIILADDAQVADSLLPLTFTRPVSHLLLGMGTIKDKWERLLPGRYSYRTAEHLRELFPNEPSEPDSLIVASHVVPSAGLADAISLLMPGEALVTNTGQLLAQCGTVERNIVYPGHVLEITRIYNLFEHNAEAIRSDFVALTEVEVSRPLSRTCTVIGTSAKVFLAEGAVAEGVTFNTHGGPIYVGPGAEIMEGTCLRGPVAILDHSTVNMLTRIYGATTIGRHCKVGGEINNVIIHDYTNKAHDGFLGNAVIGSWCNLGAGCVASNLKNDYTEIKLWHYPTRRFCRTGLQFCGLIMGDHSKAGINTMFNTATTLGVGVNIHGTGFPRNFIGSFQEGGATMGFSEVPLSKFFAIARRVMARRQVELTPQLERLYTAIHTLTESYR
ncbi:MAG: glucose-1-phosphate thymidylyltransferase [Firmicutes bacterium]|nr:glucose-1-phosphate thymidylyltransferase [Bacillota bacterium]MCM1400677.1 glucose-1-phosphate thymidylyltransferase [Bacteroides sp.]MCM1476371.1 glucose-1-phosphate thymidylyltransferase [Bacteroides sp.]